MKLAKKIISIVLCVSMLVAVPYAVVSAEGYDPAKGEFVFNSADMLSYMSGANAVDVSFDSAEKAMKMTVTSENNGIDPRALLDMSSLSLKADDYGSLVVIYRVPTDASSAALQTELFISA